MALLSTLPRVAGSAAREARGFTLLEIMVVVALVAIVGGLSIMFGTDSYRMYSFRSDRDLLVVALQHARAQAVFNMCLGTLCSDGKSHGVYVENNTHVIFQGASYAARDIAVDAVITMNPNTETSGVSEVVFQQLSGDASPSSITLSEAGRISTITIGSEGQITWQ